MRIRTFLKTIFVLFLLGMSIYFFKDYFEFKSAMINGRTISYSFIDKKINKGGRGETFEMNYLYKNLKKSILITSNEYYFIEQGKYPELYISKKSGIVFSKWSIKRSFRIGIVFLCFATVFIFPYSLFRKLIFRFVR